MSSLVPFTADGVQGKAHGLCGGPPQWPRRRVDWLCHVCRGTPGSGGFNVPSISQHLRENGQFDRPQNATVQHPEGGRGWRTALLRPGKVSLCKRQARTRRRILEQPFGMLHSGLGVVNLSRMVIESEGRVSGHLLVDSDASS